MPKIIDGSGSAFEGIIRQLKVSSMTFLATGLIPAFKGNQHFEKIPFFRNSGIAESLELVLAKDDRFSGFSSSSVLTECDLNRDCRLSWLDDVDPSAFSLIVQNSAVKGSGGSCLLKKLLNDSCSPASKMKFLSCSSDISFSKSSFSSG